VIVGGGGDARPCKAAGMVGGVSSVSGVSGVSGVSSVQGAVGVMSGLVGWSVAQRLIVGCSGALADVCCGALWTLLWRALDFALISHCLGLGVLGCGRAYNILKLSR
jgi:hypothetical protein